MAYELIEKFNKILGGAECFVIRAPLSPLLLSFPWQDQQIPLDLFSITKGRDTLEALNEDNYFEIARLRFEKYYKGELTLKFFKEEYYNFSDEMQVFYDKNISSDLSKLSDDELTTIFKELLSKFLVPLQNTIYIECIDYDKILSVIGQDKKAELDAIWEDATHPTFMSFDGRRLKFLIDLVSSGQDNLVKKVKYIYTDYVWTKDESEIQSLLNEIKNNSKDKNEEYLKLKKEVDERKRAYDAWFAGQSATSKMIAEYMQMVMLFRDVRKDVLAQMQAVMCEVATEMSSRAGLDDVHARTIIIFEYIKGIEYIKSIKGEIEKRQDGFMSLVRADGTYDIKLCDFDRAHKEFEEIIMKHVQTDTIKGFIANKGKYKGTVRVVLDPHEYAGFNKGDILVTSMTRPEFVPLMKQAGAVVTNEGGITCHAAIVSRELGIPCIIGTKIATRTLKDGDMVEVDADNGGVVRILK